MRFINNGVMLETVDWKEGDGRWDCIYRSAYAAMAYDSFELQQTIKQLLFDRERWPKELGKPSKRMTRDPYIMFYCLEALMIGHVEGRSFPSIPWYLYRPHVWAWRKYLITGEEKYKKRYEFWARLGMRLIKYPVYGLVLEAFMAYTADFGITEVKMEIRKQVVKRRLEWNLLLMILTAGDAFLCREHWVPFAKAYQPKERNQWTEETWRTDGYYTGDYKIDLDILTYLLER